MFFMDFDKKKYYNDQLNMSFLILAPLSSKKPAAVNNNYRLSKR